MSLNTVTLGTTVALGTAEAALVVSVLSLVLGVANAIFAFVYWRRSGPVVKVSSALGFPVYNGQPGETHVAVQAVNKGRTPATVEGWGIRFLPGDSDLVLMQPPPWLPTLPHRLEPSSSATWYIDLSDIEETMRQHPGGRPTAWVRLAGGQRVFAPAPVNLS